MSFGEYLEWHKFGNTSSNIFSCCHFLLTFVCIFLDPAHEDYSNLQSAYEAMLDVSEYINEVKRDSEQLQIINDIQASITDLPIAHGVELKDYGRLRKDAELKVCYEFCFCF